ncbi:MAG: cytochrome b N-terminal domain-containing protein [Caldisericia bacterium]|nr:cytochrome b N-terminal domain-containing protein [Caldisericia bacterium]
MTGIEKFGNWLANLSRMWDNWWKLRGQKFQIFDESVPEKKSKYNPFYWIGFMLYVLLILQVALGITLTFFYVPDTTVVEKFDPSLVKFQHGKTLDVFMNDVAKIKEESKSLVELDEHRAQIFEIIGMTKEEITLKAATFNADTNTEVKYTEYMLQESIDKANSLKDVPEDQLSETDKLFLPLQDQKATDLIAATTWAGLDLDTAMTEATELQTEISDKIKMQHLDDPEKLWEEVSKKHKLDDKLKAYIDIATKTEDQYVYEQLGIQSTTTLAETIKKADELKAKPEEELTDEDKALRDVLADKTAEAVYAEIKVGEEPVNVAFANAKPLIDAVTEIKAENETEAAEFAYAGKSPWTIVNDDGLLVSRAYISVAKISEKPLTRWIRGIHRYGAYGFIALLMLRWLRMYFTGEFKKPGELTWIIATLFVVISTFSGVTGYLLPFDQRSYWATTIGTQMLDSVDQLPVIGPLGVGAALKFIGLGAHQVGQTTILRFNILHYFIPILMYLAAEIYFMRSRKPRPKFNWIAILLIVVCIIGANLYLPATNEPPPNTVKTPDHILPDWYFLFVYFYLKFIPGAIGPAITILFIVFLLFIPWIDNRIKREASNRPAFTTLGIGGLIFFFVGSIFSYWVLFQEADRPYYIWTMIIFNGLVFVLAFVLEYIWRRRVFAKRMRTATQLGVDVKLVR